MKKTLIVFWLIIAWIPVYSAGEFKEAKEELLRELAGTKQDTSRLRVLFQLTGIVKSNPEERARYADMLLEEAGKQQNNEYKCHAYLIHMFLAYNMYDADKANKWMALLEPLARKEKLYDLLFQGKQCVVDLLMLKEEYELEEKEAMKMLQEAQELNNTIGIVLAYQSLGYAYQATYRVEKAFNALEKAWEVSQKTDNFILSIEILSTLIRICKESKDYANWLKYLDIYQAYVNKTLKLQPATVQKNQVMMAYISYLNYYNELEDWEKARKYMDLADRYYSEEYSRVYKNFYYFAKCDYYSKIDSIDKALQCVDKKLELLYQVSVIEYLDALIEKARLLARAGREEEALQVYKRARSSKDSIRIVVLDKQAEQLKSSYEMNSLLLEMETRRQQRHLALLVLFGSIILVLGCFTVHIYRVKQKLERAESIMRRMKDDMEQANLVKERFLSNINLTIRPSLDSIVGSSFRLTDEKEIDPSEKERLSGIIDETSKELMELINDILLLSKLEAGMLKYNMAKVDVREIVYGLVARNGIRAPEIPENAGYEIEADINYFTQVINSLLRNREAEKREITLKLEELPGSPQLSVRVVHSELASPEPSQIVFIRNEINRMLIENFGGRYRVTEDAVEITLSVRKFIKNV